MKTLFLTVLVGISLNVYGQNGLPETDHYANFHVQGNEAYWGKHYAIPNAPIKDGIMSSANLKGYQEGEGKLYADLVDFVFKKGSDLTYGRAIVTPDSTGYTVILRGISFKPGTNRMIVASAYNVQVNGVVNPFDAMFVKNGKLKTGGRKSMDMLNNAFTKLFEFRP